MDFEALCEFPRVTISEDEGDEKSHGNPSKEDEEVWEVGDPVDPKVRESPLVEEA